MTKELEELLSTSHQITADQVESVAIKSGMITLLQDALIKVLTGYTTLDEVESVLEF